MMSKRLAGWPWWVAAAVFWFVFGWMARDMALAWTADDGPDDDPASAVEVLAR